MADSVEYPDLVIVGAGLFGLTVAQQAVEHTGARVRARGEVDGRAAGHQRRRRDVVRKPARGGDPRLDQRPAVRPRGSQRPRVRRV